MLYLIHKMIFYTSQSVEVSGGSLYLYRMKSPRLIIILITVLVGGLRAQPFVVPSRILYIDEIRGDTFAQAIFLSRSNPIIVERRLAPEYEAVFFLYLAQDTFILNNQRLTRRACREYANFLGRRDTAYNQLRITYPTSQRTLFDHETWSQGRWVPQARVDMTNGAQGLPDLLMTTAYNYHLVSFMDVMVPPFPFPIMYKVQHVGDTLKEYDLNSQNSSPVLVYARKPSRGQGCDSLLGDFEVELCFESGTGLLSLQNMIAIYERGNNVLQKEESIRSIYYDNQGRLVKDSTDSYFYLPATAARPDSHARKVLTYRYDSQNRLVEVVSVNISKGGGVIGRLAGRFSSLPPFLRLNSQDTSRMRIVLEYGGSLALSNRFSESCLRWNGREVAFTCLGQAERLPLALYDALGHQLWQGEVSGSSPAFHLPHTLPPGIYILRAGAEAIRLYLQP